MPYSLDLRRKVLEAYDRGGETQKSLAARFDVSTSFIEKLLRRRRTTGSIAAKPRGGGWRSPIDAAALDVLREHLERKPDATLAELCQVLQQQAGVTSSEPAVCRALKKLPLTRKKSHSTPASATRHASSRSEPSSRKSSPRSSRAD